MKILKTISTIKHLLASLLFLTLLSTSAFAQVIKGTISYDNEPLAGVTVTQLGTQNGTITDLDGTYLINVSEGQDTLVFSYIGLKTLYKSFNLKKGETIIFDTTLTEDKYNKYPSFLWEVLGGIPIYGNKYAFLSLVPNHWRVSQITLSNNNYIKYYNYDGVENVTTGIKFQPEIEKVIHLSDPKKDLIISAMIDLSTSKHYYNNLDSNNLSIRPHFGIEYRIVPFTFIVGYNKATKKELSMAEPLYNCDHYYFSEVNDGFTIKYDSWRRTSIVLWLDCVGNNIFNNKWNKDILCSVNISKKFNYNHPLRNLTPEVDILFTNQSYLSYNSNSYAKNLESGMFGIKIDIPRAHLSYTIKYAQSHFFDTDAQLNNKSGNGIFNQLQYNKSGKFDCDFNHFYAKDYISTYSNFIYNCFNYDSNKISVLSLGASYQCKKRFSNIETSVSIHARAYQDIINDKFSYSVGMNILLIPHFDI